MFAPPVTKPKSANPRRSTVAGQRSGRTARELSGQSAGVARNEPGPRKHTSTAERMTGRAAAPLWDFSKIPVFSAGQAERLQLSPSVPASGLPAQATLNRGAINNRLEHEADSVADQVVRMPDPGGSVTPAPPQISRNLWARLPPISPSSVTLRRDDKTEPPEQRALDRPGAKWPFGPVTQHKSTQHDLYDYILAVKHVESAYGADKESVLQRLRRLYYSSFSGKGEYDRVIAEQAGAGGGDDPPLDARLIGTTAVDFLYETNVLKLPDNELIDVSHVLAALDVKVSGLTFKAEGAEPAIGIRWLGVVTWAGDLAAWMANYIERDRASPEGPPPPADPAPQKVDLISDMDAQILAEENVRPSTPEHVKAEGRIVHDRNIATELSMPVSELLDSYFGIGQGTAQPQNLRNRFDKFVRIATPPIPHRGANPDGSGPITLTVEAADAIYDAVYNTAWLLVVHGSSYSYGRDVLAQYTPHFREVARRFAQFLTTGLATGDAPWPGIGFNR